MGIYIILQFSQQLFYNFPAAALALAKELVATLETPQTPHRDTAGPPPAEAPRRTAGRPEHHETPQAKGGLQRETPETSGHPEHKTPQVKGGLQRETPETSGHPEHETPQAVGDSLQRKTSQDSLNNRGIPSRRGTSPSQADQMVRAMQLCSPKQTLILKFSNNSTSSIEMVWM